MYFQHDGVPAHYATNVRAFLDETFQNRWIGRGGAVAWPPRSPDMDPLDFYFCGHLKFFRQQVIARIHTVVATITSDILQRVQENVHRRAAACVQVQGATLRPVLSSM